MREPLLVKGGQGRSDADALFSAHVAFWCFAATVGFIVLAIILGG